MTTSEKFEDAQRRVKTLTQSPSTDHLLELYALYKQGTVGDVDGKRPGMLDLKGRAKKYLNLCPSETAPQKEREQLHEMTNSHQCFKPIPVPIGELNRQVKGWANYFSIGYPITAYQIGRASCRERVFKDV